MNNKIKYRHVKPNRRETRWTPVDNEKFPDKTGIKILTGQFIGMVLIYGNVRFTDAEPPVMQFDYEVMVNPNKVKYKGSGEFEFIISDILVELIDNQLSIEGEDDRRDDYSELSDERDILAEGHSVR
jgi:hypothetical protein